MNLLKLIFNYFNPVKSTVTEPDESSDILLEIKDDRIKNLERKLVAKELKILDLIDANNLLLTQQNDYEDSFL